MADIQLKVKIPPGSLSLADDRSCCQQCGLTLCEPQGRSRELGVTGAGFPRERGLLRRILPWLFAAQEWAVVRRSGAVTFSNNHPRLWHLTPWHCLGKLFMLLGAARQVKPLVSFCRDSGHRPSDRSAPWDPARARQSAPRGV